MAICKILADSNFFIALFNPSDSLHEKAIAISKKIKEESLRIYISNYLFLEIVTIISQRVGKKEAVILGKHLLEDEQIEIIHINEKLNNLSWKIFQEINKKDTSFADCSNLAILQTEEIKIFLTFDGHYINLQKEHNFEMYTLSAKKKNS